MTPKPLRLAIIANEQTPYRLHLHQRITREMPEIELWSLFTHEVASSPWRHLDDRQIRPVLFGSGEAILRGQTLRASLREWTKGGEIVRWLAQHHIGAIVLYGYNDAARLRIVRWAAAQRIPCFLFGDSNIRSDKATGFRSILKRRYVPWILRQTAGVFHCGRLGWEYFVRYGVPPDHLYPFPYEPDYSLLGSAGSAQCAAVRCRYGLPERRRYLLFAGRMIAAKRPDLLLTAFNRIAESRPEWDLVMVGEGPLRASLQSLVDPSLVNRIHWPGFIDDTAELAALYGVCDVFVLPSDFEPWGVVLAEAATRMALIASSVVGAAADLIKEGVNGKIFPRGDLHGLQEALLEVTGPGATDAMKAASPVVLAQWRESTNPIRNLRTALQNLGLLAAEQPVLHAR